MLNNELPDFNEMLDNVYNNLEQKASIKLVLPLPELKKNGSMTIWNNVKDYLTLINHPNDNLIQYINNKTPHKVIWRTSNIEDGINFNNKIKKEDIYHIFKKYVSECIICKQCNSLNTECSRDKILRENIVNCMDCNSIYLHNL